MTDTEAYLTQQIDTKLETMRKDRVAIADPTTPQAVRRQTRTQIAEDARSLRQLLAHRDALRGYDVPLREL